LNAEIQKMLASPEVKEKLQQLAFTPVGGSRADFTAFIKAEIAKWSKIAKDSGAKAD
jgi:tripartite-type tricarboxylate transporter receptor subunit TctC